MSALTSTTRKGEFLAPPTSRSTKLTSKLTPTANTPTKPPTTSSRNLPISRRHIEHLIAQGQLIVIVNAQVLRLDKWVEAHPGGKLPLEHMVGVDASCEVAAYHSFPTLARMSAYRIGRVDGHWKNFLPPIRGGVFRLLDDQAQEQELAEEHDSAAELTELDSGYWSVTDDTASESEIKGKTGAEVGAGGSGLRKRSMAPVVNRPRGVSDVTTASSASAGSSGNERVDRDLDAVVSAANKTAATPPAKTRDDHIDDAMQAEIDKGLAAYPSPDVETQREVADRFKILHQRVHDEGYYRCNYWNYAKEMTRYTALFAGFLLCLRAGWYFTSAGFLGFFWQQIMFTAHDAGHRGITGKFIPDTLIGIFIADFCCGLSIGWWKSSHNVHHLVTNSPEHDPDIQNTPLFATCPSQFRTLRSTYYDFTFVWDKACEVLVPFQKYAYYPIMAVARFNLYILGWCHLLSPRSKNLGAAAWTRPAEIIGMSCYWFMFGYVLVLKTLPDWYTRVGFVLVSHMITMILHVQITLSHWGMPTSDLGNDESFAQRQLRTTMDVLCPAWMDFVHGGLQFQAIHHLFPRVPRHNLRALQPMVLDFCEATGIKYTIHGFVEGNTHVVGRLRDISHQLAMLGKCQDHMAKTGESGLH